MKRRWTVYLIGGARATHLGAVTVPDRDAAITEAAAKYGVRASNIVFVPSKWPMPEHRPVHRRGAIVGHRVDREVTSEAQHFIRCPTCR